VHVDDKVENDYLVAKVRNMRKSNLQMLFVVKVINVCTATLQMLSCR